MYRNPSCTKTLKWRQPNERNVTGSSIKINFHSRWGKKNYLKAQKMFKISQTQFAAWTHVRINYSRKSESVSFSHKFCSYFIGCGFVYHTKSWIQLRTNMYITCTIFFSKVQAAALNPLSVFKTLLKAHRSSRLRERKIIHKKSLRAPFTLHVKRTIQRYSQWLWVCTAL